MTFVLALAGTGFAWPPGGNGGGGGGGGGGEDPPPPDSELPPVEYIPAYVATATNELLVNDLNDSAMAVGWYVHTSGVQNGWIYDPSVDVSTAIDLNDLAIDGLDDDGDGLNDWYIASAVGLNNNGLVVGYVRPFDDPTYRAGFVLDLDTMIVHSLPDQNLADSYARRVNDNGDVLGQFVGADDLHYAYVFNPGLRGDADADIEVINTPVGSQRTELSNPPPGVPTQIVGGANDGSATGVIFQYTRGGSAVYRYDLPPGSVTINDSGVIAGTGYEIIPLKGKTKSRTDYFLWRDSGTVEEFIYDSSLNSGCREVINSGTALSGAFDNHVLFHDDYGFVHVVALIPGGGHPVGFGNACMNNVGPLGFGQIAGVIPATGELYILTPFETP